MKNNAKETCSRALAFTRPLSEEDLLKVKEEAERKRQLEKQEEAAANVALNEAISELSKAASKGVYHKSTASRKISRMTKAVNAIQ